MKPKEIIRELMKTKGYSNLSLAKKLGKSTPTTVSNALSRENGMRIDTFMKMLDALDCDIIVRSRLKDKTEWKLETSATE